MRPIIRHFTYYSDHNNQGNRGWVMKGFESLEPAWSFGVAHDALEHFDATLGPESELLALGAILWGRYSHDYWTSNTRHALGYLVSDWEKFFEEGCATPAPCPGQIHHFDDYLELALSELNRRFESSLERWITSSDADNMVKWVRKGIHASERRFARLSGTGFMDVFRQIAEAKETNSDDYEDGTKLTIRVCPDARVQLIVPERYW